MCLTGAGWQGQTRGPTHATAIHHTAWNTGPEHMVPQKSSIVSRVSAQYFQGVYPSLGASCVGNHVGLIKDMVESGSYESVYFGVSVCVCVCLCVQ